VSASHHGSGSFITNSEQVRGGLGVLYGFLACAEQSAQTHHQRRAAESKARCRQAGIEKVTSHQEAFISNALSPNVIKSELVTIGTATKESIGLCSVAGGADPDNPFHFHVIVNFFD
jgi:hypothetical protein